jgi:isoquinoline 1-oxidoreductase beta subunit
MPRASARATANWPTRRAASGSAATSALKTPAQFVYIGKDKASPRVDSASKCDGSAVYTIDVKLPGLLTAVIAWPPSFGAKLVSFDAAEAKRVKGVTDVVQVPEGVAVVATGTWAALQGRRALKVQWDESTSKGLDSDQLLASYKAQAAQPGKTFAKPSRAATPAAKTVEAVYEFPFLAHASMEPMNCVAWLHDGMLETWSGHQFPTFDHKLAAEAAGLPMDKVKLHTLVSAAASAGAPTAGPTSPSPRSRRQGDRRRAPVRLQYTREDDTGAGLYRPMYVHSVKASVDGAGRIADWKHVIVGQSIVAGTPMEMMVKDGIDPTSVEGVAESAYSLPMLQGELHSPALAVRPLWWRSVGSTHTAFVMETMMDELAAAAGKDPLAFRLARPRQEPARSRRAAPRRREGRLGQADARGLAQGIAVHESFKSFVAQVAEVSMQDGKVKVERVVCAVDCGIAVNPDVIRAQMEGGIGFALGALYYGEIELRNGRAAQRNFDTYRSLRIHEMPKDRGAHRRQRGRAHRRRRARRAAARAGGRQRHRPARRAAGCVGCRWPVRAWREHRGAGFRYIESRHRGRVVVRVRSAKVAVEVPDRPIAMAAGVALGDVARDLEMVEAGLRLHVEPRRAPDVRHDRARRQRVSP